MGVDGAPAQSSVLARVQDWQANGAPALPTTRGLLIEALARRAAMLEGDVRLAIEARLSGLLDELVVAAASTEANTAAAPCGEKPGPLGELAAMIGTMHADAMCDAAQRERAAYPELPALDAFRRRWESQRADTQLKQAMAEAPADAGPANSSVLVHRATVLMRDVSEEYLRQFLAYVDALAWLEKLHDYGVLGPQLSQQTASSSKPAAKSPGKRSTRARSR